VSVPDRPVANVFIEKQLDGGLRKIGDGLAGDVITFCGQITAGSDLQIRDALEAIRPPRRRRIGFILDTPGGYIEVAERIADTLRRHYRFVEFIIPDSAMSAGTVLVMSGDKIHMDYFSVLGPIDPQALRPSGGSVPALGYLAQYERLIEKSRAGTLTTAEMTFLVQRFDPAELYSYEQSRDLSISLLKEWLVKYKFKNWKVTKTRRITVTKQLKEERAEQIATELNNTKTWKSHSRGVAMAVLRRRLNLEIEDFGQNPKLTEPVRSYYDLLQDYMGKMGHDGVVHTLGRYTPLVWRSRNA
jgi:hypothetical protein